MSNKSIIFLCHSETFFYSHRINIANYISNFGYKISLLFPNRLLINRSNTFRHIYIGSSHSLFGKFIYLYNLIKFFRKTNIKNIHVIGLESIIFFIITMFFSNSDNKIIFSFAGLGIIFSSKKIKYRVLSKVVRLILYVGLNKYSNSLFLIFQNTNDRDNIIKLFIKNFTNYKIIPGSGIDLKNFKKTQFNHPFNITFASRLLIDKGIFEFLKIAKFFIERYPKLNVNFFIAGDIKNSPDYISRDKLHSFLNERIKYLGNLNNIYNLLNTTSLFIYPSRYGEGFPKVLIEASAMSIPIITSNNVGCRDAISHEISGFIADDFSPEFISDLIFKFYTNSDFCKLISKNGRTYAEMNFDINNVNKAHHEIYDSFLH